ncbi:FAD-dependent oxidoreductase [Streptomyces sp. NBC_01369]|uniref:FAD-dependent oxidoreductase n=1 Tax=unclassified Streptomyces TaxID=2593676 RepID=UPI0022554F4B|nr:MULTISPECIES: FAD-dependent oxidoreductase [unclassified Streptomyces]MCX4869251.1 FAD-dependent oxidoreductase [Streptomyces sp. NBC_00906]MCX4900489.1 FAD-dependent oxidoreductase [Streptomyces sp. NBC_00892]
MNRHIVVVGAAAAGLAVTEQLRRLGYDGDLSLVGAENHPPYDRPPLSKRFLAGELSAEQLRLAEPEALDRLSLSMHRGRRAVTADLDSRTVTLDDGTVLTYTDLVVATGVAPRGLTGTGPSDGGGEPGGVGRPGPVGMLKTLDDARALAEQLRPGRRVVIAGGGFLGTETAWTAIALGCEVTLVNRAATPLAVLGGHVGSLVGERLRAAGANLLTGRTVPFFWTDQGPHKIVVHGLLTPGAEFKPLEVDPERDRFTGVYRLDGRPVAVLAWNSPKEALRLRRELLTDPQSARAPTPTAPAEPAAGMPVPQ